MSVETGAAQAYSTKGPMHEWQSRASMDACVYALHLSASVAICAE